MADDKPQKELFELDKPKRSFPRLANILPKADFERNILITLSLDKLIFISIGIIMLLVLVYALGVEVGRSRTIEKIGARGVIRAPTAVKAVNLPAAALKPYSILAGTFTKKENAQAVAARLRRYGFNAFIMQYGSYFRVYVGSFDSAGGADAKKELARVRRIHKDALIKQR